MGQGEDDENELAAAFGALGGQLTWDELARLLGSGRYPAGLMRQVTTLVGDVAAAKQIVQDSFAALLQRGPVAEQDARVLLYRAILNRARSAWWQGDVPRAEPGGLLALPYRQREALVLCNYAGLSVSQAASAMGISTGAARSHLATAVSSLGR
jgi:DNA-directed RNA polymerase specialized sigma24 family protein